MKKRGHDFQVALESIDFQNNSFFVELTNLIKEAREELKGKSDDQMRLLAPDYTDRFTAIVHKYTKSAIRAEINDQASTNWMGPYALAPSLNKNHPLINDFRRRHFDNADLKKLTRDVATISGSVDLRTGYVSGGFARIEATLVIPVRWIRHDYLTEEEVAAVCLHEVGHILTYFEYIARSVSTNQVLAFISKTYTGQTYVEREKILVAAKEVLNLKNLKPEELAKMDDAENVNVVIVTEAVQQSRSELGSNIYDYTSFEQLADDYAARMGAARAMVTGLEKLHKGDFLVRNRASYFILEANKLLMLVGGIGSALLGGVGIIFGVVALLMYAGRVSMDSNKDASPAYDTPRDRFQRLRNQLVAAMKDKKLPAEMAKQYAEDIKVIDEILDRIPGNRQLYDVIREYINPFTRKARNQMMLQRELEDLAHNDLFLVAQDIKNQS